jgi:hypothetical protein
MDREYFYGKPFCNNYFDNRVKDVRITLRWNTGAQVISVDVCFGLCPTAGLHLKVNTEFVTSNEILLNANKKLTEQVRITEVRQVNISTGARCTRKRTVTACRWYRLWNNSEGIIPKSLFAINLG